MSTFSIINEDFLDDLVQDATLNEPVVQNEINDFRFAVVIAGRVGDNASNYASDVAKFLKRFPDVIDFKVIDGHDSETSKNDTVFDMVHPLVTHWTCVKAVAFNALFRTSRSIMLFVHHLHDIKKDHRMYLYAYDDNIGWLNTEILSSESFYDLIIGKPWNKKYPYSLSDLIESPDQLKSNIRKTICLWRSFLADKLSTWASYNESFYKCDKCLDIMSLISLVQMQRSNVMRSDKFLTVDASILNKRHLKNKSITGRMLWMLASEWSFSDIREDLYVHSAKVTIVNAYPYTCVVMLAFCGDTGCPSFAYSKELIKWESPEEMSKKKNALIQLYQNMFDITESESASLVEEIWKTSGLDKDRRSVYDN